MNIEYENYGTYPEDWKRGNAITISFCPIYESEIQLKESTCGLCKLCINNRLEEMIDKLNNGKSIRIRHAIVKEASNEGENT